MKFYHTTTAYACGVDLHSRQMYICLMDREGQKLVHTNVKGNDFGYPRAQRPTRALLRQRLTYVWRRAELLTRLELGQLAQGHPPVPKGGHNAILANKLARAVYYMLKQGTAFDPERFVSTSI